MAEYQGLGKRTKCAEEVGKEVARIVEEVNEHHHTKTCKPPKCRFKYPKFPIWKTILVKP